MVAPISGGYFPIQLAALKSLTHYKYKPNIVLASSGGTVATYCACAAHWTPVGIDRVANSLDSRLFIRSWFSESLDFMPSVIAGFFYGAVYRGSDLCINFFQTYFTEATITETEIWVGAVNDSTGSICLFCNRDKHDSIIKGKHFNQRMFKSEPLRYLSGNIEKIMKAATASGSIPIVVEPVNIDGKMYIDCGAKFASPLTPIQDEISHLAGNRGIHITYIAGYNVEGNLDDDYHMRKKSNLIDKWESVPNHVVRGFVLHDRMTAYEIINDKNGLAPFFAEFCIDMLGEILDRKQSAHSSLLEIYPKQSKVLNILSFTGKDIIKYMRYAARHLGIRLWWTGNPNLFDDIRLDKSPDHSDDEEIVDDDFEESW